MPRVLAEPVFTGREKELEELMRFLDSAVERKGTTVFISGEAGSGKTRLTHEFLNASKKKGVTVLSGWCLSDAAIPYFPFIEAFNAYFASSDEEEPIGTQEPGIKIDALAQIGVRRQEMATWLSEPKPLEKPGKPEPLSPQVWKDQAFDRVAKTLLTISAPGPLILFLEDIHWADSASLALLHYISRVVKDSEKILVLATFRSEELTADAEGHPHSLEEEMRAMSREDLFTEIKLQNLNPTNVSTIAQNMMGGPVQEELVEKLAKESNGNALFIVESLRMLVEQKSLIQENNQWRLTADDFGIPSKIKDIILRRLAILKYAQRRVLDAAAVIGEKFNVELLASVLEQDSLSMLDALNFIAQSTSIVSDEGAFYKFDHARSREVLYGTLSLSLKKGYHARVAERLESAGKDGKLAFADLAYHYTQAGNEEKAVKYSLSAGEEAIARWSNTEAVRHFEYVLQKVGDAPERLAEKTTALEGLGDAFYACNNFHQAVGTFEQLAEIQFGLAKLRALRKAIVAAYFQGDVSKVKELLQKAEDNASTDRVEAARILDHKARVDGLQYRLASGLKFLEESVSVYEEEYSLRDAAWDLFAAGFCASNLDQLEKGVASVLRSVALYDELGDVHSQLEAYLFAGHCFGNCGLAKEAIGMYSKIVEIDEKFKLNDYVRLIPAYINLSNYSFREDPQGADLKILRALEYCEKTDSRNFLGQVYEFLLWQSVYRGDMDRAEECFKKLSGLPQEILTIAGNIAFLDFAKAAYFAGKSLFDEANKYYNSYIKFVKVTSPAPAMEALARQAYAWCLDKQGRMEDAKAQLEQAQEITEKAQKRFIHVNVQAGLMTFIHPQVGQIFEVRLDLVNVSRSHGSIVRVDSLVVPELDVVGLSPNCLVSGGCVEFRDSAIGPFEVKTIKLTVKAAKPVVFRLSPTVTYVDDLGETKTCSTRPFTMTVESAPKETQVAGKSTTGFRELDKLLLGGIPEGCAVALTSPSFDEGRRLIEQFVEAGPRNGEATFYLTDEPGKEMALAEEYQSSMFLFICNPRADSMARDLPNVYRLKGVDNLTDIDIALAKASRQLDSSQTSPKRACIEIISDVLLQHRVVNSRKWLSGLIQDLRSRGFTILTVVNLQMHPLEEAQAILSLFDGEICIHEKETPKGAVRFLKIKRMTGQKYIKDEIPLTEE